MAVSCLLLGLFKPNLGILWNSACSFTLCRSIVANPIIYRHVLSPPTYEIRQFCAARAQISQQSLSINLENMASSMASNLVRNRMRTMFRTYLALEERILHNLGLIYGGQNFQNAALLGNMSPSIESDGNLDTKHDGFLLMAVPKKKTTPHKKKIRNRHRQLKNRTDIEVCAICGNHKLENHLCGHCVERIKEETKKVRKERNEDSIEWPIPDILKQFRT